MEETKMNRKPTILIIDDDADMVESVKKLLGSKGYDILSSDDPDEGYNKVREIIPDLIILDVMFGNDQKTKGFDLARKLKIESQFTGIPILMLTGVNEKKPGFGFSPEEDRDFLPVDSFLDKPFHPGELFSKVEDLLQRKTMRSPI